MGKAIRVQILKNVFFILYIILIPWKNYEFKILLPSMSELMENSKIKHIQRYFDN